MPRPVSWIRGVRKNFDRFPEAARRRMARALRQAALGEMADIAKPWRGLGPGVFEVALRYRTDASRVVYAVQIDEDVWVLHAFQKKSKTGVKTPKQDLDLIRERLKRLQEELK